MLDAPSLTVVEHGSNLASKDVHNLHSPEVQLCPISTEAPWSLRANERSCKFLQKTIDLPWLQPDYNTDPKLTGLLCDVNMVWTLTLHVNGTEPRPHHFDIMPRVRGSVNTPSRISES